MVQKRDVFLCHASEEKNSVIHIITKSLDNEGISYWLDEAEIKWGDIIIEKINEGLKISDYVLVVLSVSFLSKNYAQKEMNSALHIEATTGKVRVLPLLVGTEAEKKRIFEAFPILNDKKYESWDSGDKHIIQSLRSRLSDKKPSLKSSETSQQPTFEIPMPNIKKKFTQLEKDRFAKQTFEIIKSYFQRAQKQLEKSEPDIEADYTEITNFSFITKIYLRGETKCQCKIWLGGISQNCISYYSGDLSFNHGNSYSDWLSITDEGHELGYESSGMGKMFRPEVKGILDQRQAAEYLWKRFTESLNT